MRTRFGGRWAPSSFSVTAVTIALGLVGNIATGLIEPGWRWWPWAVGVAVTALVVTALVFEWLRARGEELPDSERLKQAEETLAGLVFAQWRDEARVWGLDQPDPIPVHWRPAGPPETSGEPAVSGSSDRIDELARRFRALRRRRLIIVGGPGTGKTTLAVQLIRELLATRAQDEPVPVLLPMNGWDLERLPALQDWLAFRLVEDYRGVALRFGEETVRALVGQGRILMVLDGLDETADPAGVLDAVNRSLADSDQLIVTSRHPQYAEGAHLSGPVTSAAAIEPDPLTPEAAAAYLESSLPPAARADPRWGRLLAAVRSARPGDPLGELTSTPLGLWLLRTVHTSRPGNPEELDLFFDALSDAATLRSRLLDRLIPALVSSREPSRDPARRFRPRRSYDPVKTARWLGFLADHLRRGGDGAPLRDLAWRRLAERELPPLHGSFYVVSAVFFGALFGRFSEPLGQNVVFAVLMGGLVGLGAALFADGGQAPMDKDPDTGWTPRSTLGCQIQFVQLMTLNMTFMAILLSGLAVVLAVVQGILAIPSLLWDLVVEREISFAVDLSEVLSWGTLAVLVAANVYIFVLDEDVFEKRQKVTPMGDWRASRSTAFRKTAAAALMAGLALGHVGGLHAAPGGGLAAAFMGGSAGALLFGLTLGGRHSWAGHVALTWRLSRRGLLPRRLMPFLDDMHRLGLLRAVGPLYQFRHAEIQDHLAARYRRLP